MSFLFFLIQILIESLPISSSGHLLIAQKLGLVPSIDNQTFYFLAHMPALGIMIIYFYRSWIKLLCAKQTLRVWLRIIYFFLIVELITLGCWLWHWSENVWLQKYFLPFGFMITAGCLYVTKFFNGTKTISWQPRDAFFLGMVQGLSLLPGISRFASTFCTASVLGYARADAFSLSFLIQAPLLVAATFKSFVICMQHDCSVDYIWFLLMISIGVCSFMLFSWVGFLIERNRLWYFAFYMLIPLLISVWLMKGFL